jgi:hypothetical protein
LRGMYLLIFRNTVAMNRLLTYICRADGTIRRGRGRGRGSRGGATSTRGTGTTARKPRITKKEKEKLEREKEEREKFALMAVQQAKAMPR